MKKASKASPQKAARRLSAKAEADPKVHKFPREYREAFPPEPAVVAHCERLVQDARSGRLRALAYTTVYHDDLSPAGSVDHGFCCGSGTYYAVSHGVRRLSTAWDLECTKNTTDPAVSPPPKPA